MEKIGLIAGNRRFPFVFSEAAKKKNYYVVAVAVKGDTCRSLSKFVDKIYWLDLSEFSRMFEIFRKEEVKKVVMAGQISPHRLFSAQVQNNPELKTIFAGLADKKADTIFGAVAKRLADEGFELLDSIALLGDFLPAKGVLTTREPTFQQWEDIYFGFDLAKEIAYLDIGQTVVVKNKAIVAVEALEGTDTLIRRAARVARKGITVVKVSKPKQDKRFDIPVVGLNTLKNMVRTGASCLAIEAGKTLFIDKEESINLANKEGISIVAI